MLKTALVHSRVDGEGNIGVQSGLNPVDLAIKSHRSLNHVGALIIKICLSPWRCFWKLRHSFSSQNFRSSHEFGQSENAKELLFKKRIIF